MKLVPKSQIDIHYSYIIKSRPEYQIASEARITTIAALAMVLKGVHLKAPLFVGLVPPSWMPHYCRPQGAPGSFEVYNAINTPIGSCRICSPDCGLVCGVHSSRFGGPHTTVVDAPFLSSPRHGTEVRRKAHHLNNGMCLASSVACSRIKTCSRLDYSRRKRSNEEP